MNYVSEFKIKGTVKQLSRIVLNSFILNVSVYLLLL